MMSGMEMKVSEDMRSCMIRVERYDNKNFEGTFYNLYYGVELPFENLTRLLLMMEDLMDEMHVPQASMQTKRFNTQQKPAERHSIPVIPQRTDREVLATFQVKVLFRQGVSWQGKVRWVEENMETSFRSALELVKLMDSALPQPQVCILAEKETAAI